MTSSPVDFEVAFTDMKLPEGDVLNYPFVTEC
jgi:hypothetical protein